MLFQCWLTVYDVGPTLKKLWVNVLSLLGAHHDGMAGQRDLHVDVDLQYTTPNPGAMETGIRAGCYRDLIIMDCHYPRTPPPPPLTAPHRAHWVCLICRGLSSQSRQCSKFRGIFCSSSHVHKYTARHAIFSYLAM